MRHNYFVLALCWLGLTACSGPADHPLVTGGTQEAYRASLDPVFVQMSEHEQEAFNWAVSDLDLPALHRKYPEGTPRDVIRGEVSEVLDSYPGKIETSQSKLKEYEPVRQELSKIVASKATFDIERNFFGLQPTIKASITNGSRLPVSRLNWRASLFLDGAAQPVATTVLKNDYRNDGGLKPKNVFNVRFPIGFVRGDETWTTLEIRNARTTRVVLDPVLDSVLDFGERPYLQEDPKQQIERFRAAMTAAKRYQDI